MGAVVELSASLVGVLHPQRPDLELAEMVKEVRTLPAQQVRKEW
jgi:hypothetical protein